MPGKSAALRWSRSIRGRPRSNARAVDTRPGTTAAPGAGSAVARAPTRRTPPATPPGTSRPSTVPAAACPPLAGIPSGCLPCGERVTVSSLPRTSLRIHPGVPDIRSWSAPYAGPVEADGAETSYHVLRRLSRSGRSPAAGRTRSRWASTISGPRSRPPQEHAPPRRAARPASGRSSGGSSSRHRPRAG